MIRVRKTVRLIRKECILHFGRGGGTAAVFIFPAAVTFTASYILQNGSGSAQTDALILWIITYVSSLQICGAVYSAEIDGGNHYFLSHYFSIAEIYFSKLFFSSVCVLSAFFTVTLVYLFFNGLPLSVIPHTVPLLLTGSVCIAVLLSALGIITAQSGGRNALYGILSVPLLLPPSGIVVSALAGVLSGEAAQTEVYFFLLSFSVFVCVVSLIVFERVWKSF
ncbi:MAG: hypothetical protein ACOC2H_04440 [Spirochaetota bacterium]